MIERFNGCRPPPGHWRKAAFPTLAARRRLAREMFAHQQAELARLVRTDPGSESVRTTLENINLLRQAIDYLGPDDDSDLRRNLYRLFALPLPPRARSRLRSDLTEEQKAKALRVGRIGFRSIGATRRAKR